MLWLIIGAAIIAAVAFVLRRWFSALGNNEPGHRHPD
jgi:hypothetical protein